jgi:azurin
VHRNVEAPRPTWKRPLAKIRLMYRYASAAPEKAPPRKGQLAMKRLSLLFLLALVVAWSARPLAQGSPSAQTKPAASGSGRLVEIIGTDASGKYIFKPDVINAKPGEALLVRLRSVAGTMGKMPKAAMSHNLVLLKAGVDASQFVGSAIAGGFAGDYLPPDKKDQMLASTPLAGVGETVEVSFKAPAAGTYPFVCTFPGHYALGMKGNLIVK